MDEEFKGTQSTPGDETLSKPPACLLKARIYEITHFKFIFLSRAAVIARWVAEQL